MRCRNYKPGLLITSQQVLQTNETNKFICVCSAFRKMADEQSAIHGEGDLENGIEVKKHRRKR